MNKFILFSSRFALSLHLQNNITMKLTKKQYLSSFFITVAVLSLMRCIFPKIAESKDSITDNTSTDSIAKQQTSTNTPSLDSATLFGKKQSIFFDAKGNIVKNRIFSVPRFCDAFPDSNNVQLEAAQRFGVKPVVNRADAEKRKKELVYIGASPYYTVDKLKSSIPYLVPRAAILLDEIGKSFFDSLQTKNVPLHKFIITSVLRTKEDVDKLRGTNHNATVNSCHLYGTTFDICYNRYTTVSDPAEKPRRAVRNDTLKWILSEVLRDQRVNRKCYIKYEVKQGCFHITAR